MLAPVADTKTHSLEPLDLLRCMASSAPPVLLDLRIEEDRAAEPRTLPGAINVPHTDLEGQMRLSTEHPAILFCHKGLKLTHGAAARLAAKGHRAFRLTGGIQA